MTIKYIQNGNPFGSHRVIEPQGVLPQPAEKVNNDVDVLWDNEILIDVEFLNIDSASFTQIEEQAGGDEAKIREIILGIVNSRGKMHNPVTGSGGMLIGKIEAMGEKIRDTRDLKIGDEIVTLVSLSLTPLKIYEITGIKPDIDQVKISGKAVLFENGIYAKLPDDFSASLALAVLDVCGAPAQTAKLVRPCDTVVILGAGGKSGILCAYEAKKRAGITGKVIGVEYSEKSLENIRSLGLCDHVVSLDAQDAMACYEKISEITNGRLADLVINCVNVPNTELGSILMCRDRGRIYFFSMATSFTKAALGAEGVGKDVEMLIGNGYTKDHAEIALNVLRESEKIRNLFGAIYC
ncbi:MAG: L-erythro-3,5-diaminohexanoate dehydrogenase [Deltaproteobacteria bacterium]|nr:MAG: L-erythro-3,5-diaminohexanoate dehydrogenase [Deltaproteobacteria bacterium]